MQPLSNGSEASAKGMGLTIGIRAKALLWAACICATQGLCRGQMSGMVCTNGSGQFTSTSTTKVTVTVGAQKEDGFATHSCEAHLVWNKRVVPVASNAWQVDVDVMGVNLGMGAPNAAFQIKRSDADSRMTYEVYSLRGTPHLLRTITGGDSFRAADTDMDGRIEIWAGDAKAADGFEGIPLANIDFAPTVVMRFENGRLMDVSAEFRSYYDREIAQVRAQLNTQQLSDFKNSDGKFDSIPPWQVEKLRGLIAVKTKVLEIVWAYLYSGREQDAWQALAEMWPATDFDRIRALMVKARAGGISTEVDGVARPGLQLRKLKRVHIYDLRNPEKATSSAAPAFSNFPQAEPPTVDSWQPSDVSMPKAISLYTPPPPDVEHVFPRTGVAVDLVIDGAGKVASARLVHEEDNGAIGDTLMVASGHWKFIPAMRNGDAVASHIRLNVSPYE